MIPILDDTVTKEDLHKYEYAFNKRKTPKSKFDYALCLLRSAYKSDMKKASLLLHELLDTDKCNERDYLYHLAVVHTRLTEYNEAQHYVDRLHQTEPNNAQVATLRSVIGDRKRGQAISDVATLSLFSAMAGIAIFVVRGFFKA